MLLRQSLHGAPCAPMSTRRLPATSNLLRHGPNTLFISRSLQARGWPQRIRSTFQSADTIGDGGKSIHKAALALRNKGDVAGALEILKEGIEIYPENVYLLTTSAVIQGKIGNVVKAEKLFRKAVSLEPQNSTALQVPLNAPSKSVRKI